MQNKKIFGYGIFAAIFMIAILTLIHADGIICSSNTDCFSGYNGNEFCMNNDVFKNFLNSTCINPGTNTSYCANANVPIMLSDCGVDSWDPYGGNYCKIDGNVYHLRTGMNRECKVINETKNISGCYSEFVFDEQLVQTCSNGCTNGACNGGVINCTTSNQCGINGFTGGMICLNNNVFQNYITYTCNNAGTVNSYCSSSVNSQLKQNCTQGQTCLNGVCTSNNIICTINTDCGTSNYTGNLFCQNGNVFQNFLTFSCINPGTVQSYCNNFTAPLLKQTCTTGQTCSNGACVANNTNNTIICSTNSNCGTNGYTGDKYCDNDNVYQDYKTYTCNNPGTVNSYCSNNIDSRLMDECSRNCEDGKCTSTTKINNLYENPGFNENYSEKPYVYTSGVGYGNAIENESVIKLSGNTIKVDNQDALSQIFGNNLLLILIILIIILIVLIIIFSIVRIRR